MTNTTTKTQPQPFSAEQRKGIAQLLADAKKRAEQGFEPDYALCNRIEAEILPKLIKERGATSAVKAVQRLRKRCKEAEATLAKLGFDCDADTDMLSLAEEAPKALTEVLEKAQDSARKERQAQLLKYDKAILKVWAAEEADEAKKVVEELL